MHWIKNYSLFLFDFDGLLVNTEALHYKAYQRLCANHGHALSWSFGRYCQIAHTSAEGLRDTIYSDFPALQEEFPDWEVLYHEKKALYEELLDQGQIDMMPGAENLLRALAETDIQRCVVTNSTRKQIDAVRSHKALLNTIPHWITREDYQEPKPSPECYLYAIETYGRPGDRILGFEDSPRGLKALLGTPAEALFVSRSTYPGLEELLQQGARQVASLEELPSFMENLV